MDMSNVDENKDEYYSELYLMDNPSKKKEWIDQVNKCIDDIITDEKINR
jgi:hypothetical protein